MVGLEYRICTCVELERRAWRDELKPDSEGALYAMGIHRRMELYSWVFRLGLRKRGLERGGWLDDEYHESNSGGVSEEVRVSRDIGSYYLLLYLKTHCLVWSRESVEWTLSFRFLF